ITVIRLPAHHWALVFSFACIKSLCRFRCHWVAMPFGDVFPSLRGDRLIGANGDYIRVGNRREEHISSLQGYDNFIVELTARGGSSFGFGQTRCLPFMLARLRYCHIQFCVFSLCLG